MLTSRFLARVAVPLVLALGALAESHTITFANKCGYGSPKLMYNGKDLLNGADTYTSSGPYSGIAYLQAGYCNTNGENCTLLETTLINPTCAGCGSSTDLSLIPPHAYSVETSFAYYNGCDGQGQTCSDPKCTTSAFFASNDNFVQVECQVNDVDLLVAFCADASQLVKGMSGGGTTPSSSQPPSHTPSNSQPPSHTPSNSQPPSYTPSTPASAKPSINTSADYNDSGCGDEPTTPTPATTPTPTPTPPSVPPAPPPTGTPSNPSPSDPCDEPTPSPPATTPSTTPTPPSPPPAPPATGSGNPSDPCDNPEPTTPLSQPTPPPTMKPSPTTPPSSSPTVSHRRCRPRPSGLSAPVSAPTTPAYTPPPQSLPPSSPPTTPATTPPAGSGSPDPCDDSNDTPSPTTSQPPARRRHHRRANRIRN